MEKNEKIDNNKKFRNLEKSNKIWKSCTINFKL